MSQPGKEPTLTPVVFIIFKRTDATARVFERIREARPPKLLVIADGPRNEAERVACDQTRAIVDGVDWPCEVLRNYSDVNLGCRRRIQSGLDWAFEQVEEAIVLEDDCLPHGSFFRYCEELLARYRSDPRVRMIAGSNHGPAPLDLEASYFFSRFSLIWGWATWRRAWRDYDGELKGWPAFRRADGLKRLLGDPAIAHYWTDKFEQFRLSGKPDTWDYQWVFSVFARDGLVVVPRVNLISNIGFGEGATHTKADPQGLACLPVGYIGELRHPVEVTWNRTADLELFERGFGGERVRKWYQKEMSIHRRLKRRLDAVRRAVGLK
jgi:hypothetical protein